MIMSSTCLNLHSAADFTVAHVTVCSYRELVGFPAVQVGELAGGVGGVALQNHPHAAGGGSHVELHSLSFLPVHVGRSRPTLQVHSNTHRFTGPWTTCSVKHQRSHSLDSQLLWDDMLLNSRVLKVTLVGVSVWQWSLMVVRLTLYI